jgi:hypothetical protein
MSLGYPNSCENRKKYSEVVRCLLEPRLVLYAYKESTCCLYFKCFCVTRLISNEFRPEIKIIITNVNKANYALVSLLQSQSVLRAYRVKPFKKLRRPVATYGAES